jgi:hypothetical protein
VTEYEYYDFLNGTGSLANELALGFVTGLTAYIICVYLVGRKLSIFQSIGLTFIYSGYSLITILALKEVVARLYTVSQEFTEYTGVTLESTSLYLYGAPSVLLVAWALSIIYMISEFRKGNADESV